MSTTTTKRDDAPRGIFRRNPREWAIRFQDGHGHLHEEVIGPLKRVAIQAHAARRARVLAEPAWCPRRERETTRAHARPRITFRAYADDYKAHAARTKRSGEKEWSRVDRLVADHLGELALDAITTAHVERMRDRLLDGERSPATVNRYRDLLSAMFKRAKRLGLVADNPVTGVPKFREAGGRLIFLADADEPVLFDTLPAALRPAVALAIHTGLRWSEQNALVWRDIDLLLGTLSVTPRHALAGKESRGRTVPLNAVARRVLVDLATRRTRPNDPDEPLFRLDYRSTSQRFVNAVAKAQAAQRAAGGDAKRLDKLTWHGLRHTFASRLVMAGVDLRSVAELGGWKTLSMVQRYAHLAPRHLQDAVGRLVPNGGAALGFYLGFAESADAEREKNPR